MSDVQGLFRLAADYAAHFHDTLDERPVGPRASYGELVEALGGLEQLLAALAEVDQLLV